MIINNKTINLFLLILLALLLSGCYSSVQRKAYNEAEVIEKSFKGNTSQDLKAKAKDTVLKSDTNLDELLVYAAEHNPSLQAAFYKWKSSLETILKVKSIPDPKFQYSYFISPVYTKVGPMQNKFALSQTFPWYGTVLLKGEAAYQQSEANRQLFEEEKLRLFFNLKNAYYEYYYLGKAIYIIEENLSYLNEIITYTIPKYETTTKTQFTDLINLDMEADLFENRLNTLKAYIKPTLAQLNYYLGRKDESKIPFPSLISLSALGYSKTELMDQVIKNNPTLKSLHNLAKMEEKNKQIAYRKFIPDITLGVDYTQIGTTSGNVAHNGNDALMTTVAINLPIYFTKYIAEKNEAEAKRKMYLNKKEDKQRELFAQLQTFLYNYTDTKSKLSLYENNLIPKAKQSLHLTRESYEVGSSDYTTFINALRTLLNFELAYQEYVMKYSTAIAKIEEITGYFSEGNNQKELKL